MSLLFVAGFCICYFGTIGRCLIEPSKEDHFDYIHPHDNSTQQCRPFAPYTPGTHDDTRPQRPPRTSRAQSAGMTSSLPASPLNPELSYSQGLSEHASVRVDSFSRDGMQPSDSANVSNRPPHIETSDSRQVAIFPVPETVVAQSTVLLERRAKYVDL
ncbi:unnamed protein product [Protopolystoma xenopodis]|uniref:Uncharacterized protein n=1 Tax=Protopolystoma xenopodis TaxID=117903 RepID=A0A448XQF7_9PLAT|nr:unnamed protein product [Protopolystoma xenopodis]